MTTTGPLTKHVALDLDDVVLDFVGGLVRAINTEVAPEPPLEVADIDTWDLSSVLDPILGESWWDWWRRRDWLWATAPAIKGAIGGIEELRRRGYFVEVVTAKPRWAEGQTWHWFWKWRPPVHRVTIVGQEHISRKSEWTEAPVLVDDKVENIEEFIKAGRQGILFTRPHNRKLLTPVGATRVADWKELLNELR